ncbi:MAG: peptidoglycan editing factor PgeF [Clostridia bacterium]|nr:peptidoglycan editing factor PgeF [Clostridia bacterium]
MKDLSNENIIHVKKNDIEYIQFRKLLEYKEIAHCYTLKTGELNFRSYNDEKKKEIVENNYKRICDELDIDYKDVIRPFQMHTDNVAFVECKTKVRPDIYSDNYRDTDGVITNKKDIILATTNADCVLIMLYDPERKVIANIHAGWRGTFKKVALKTIKMMKEKYNSKPENILCFICPAIRKCHFEVRDDVKIECEKIFKHTNRIEEIISIGEVKDGAQRYFIDNVLINKILLVEAGIKEENIYDSNICSVCNSDLVHSRRADGAENFGLGTALIKLC